MGKNLKVQTKDFLIKTDVEIITNLIFKRDYDVIHIPSDQNLVRIYEEDKIKNIYMSGENIEIQPINKDIQKMVVITKGENLVIKNGDNLWVTKSGEDMLGREIKLYTKRDVGNADVNLELTNERKPEQKVKTNIQPTPQPPVIEEGTSTEKTESETQPVQPAPQSSTTTVETKEETNVCIGKFCTVGKLVGDPYETFFGYRAGTFEALVSESSVYATQQQVDEFVKMAKEKGWDDLMIVQEASSFFTQTQSTATIQRELSWSQIDPKLQTMIASLGLPQSELEKINGFKLSVLKSLPNKKIPVRTQIMTSNYYVGNNERSYGTFSILLPGGTKMTHTIQGPYFEIAKQKNIKENPYSLSEIMKKIKGN